MEQNQPLSMHTKCCYFAILAAVQLVLAFSIFGFINSYHVAITTLHIPVLLGALYLGKWGGAAMGGVFGIISMWKASNVAFTTADAYFSPFTSPDPFGSLVMSLGMRIFFGFLTGIIFEQIKKLRHYLPALAFSAGFCTYLHSVLVLGAMVVFFPDIKLNPLTITMKGITLYIFSAIMVVAIYWLGSRTNLDNIIASSVKQLETTAFTGNNFMRMGIFLGGMFVIASSLVIHFLNRVNDILAIYGYNLTLQMKSIIEGWGIQFVVSVTALSFLIFWIFTYFYEISMSVLDKSRRDGLTNLYNKDSVEQQVNSFLRGKDNPLGTFVMLDIDHFKGINDKFGHTVGDKVIREIARCLQDNLGQSDIAGRLGGDEFCLYLDGYISDDDLERSMYGLFTSIKQIALPDGSHVSCSMGVTKGLILGGFEELYSEADKAMYLSKNNGRNQYTFYER